jgi:hypothetical protein
MLRSLTHEEIIVVAKRRLTHTTEKGAMEKGTSLSDQILLK